jgi:hypothetical protein
MAPTAVAVATPVLTASRHGRVLSCCLHCIANMNAVLQLNDSHRGINTSSQAASSESQHACSCYNTYVHSSHLLLRGSDTVNSELSRMVRSSLLIASSKMQFLLTSSSFAEQCAMVAALLLLSCCLEPALARRPAAAEATLCR